MTSSKLQKLLVSALFLFGGSNLVFAQTNIPMQIINPSGSSNAKTKIPVRPWHITQDDNILTLPALADDYTLELRDENGTVAYSTFLPAGTISVVLPSELSGEIELRLVADTYYYRGFIEL